MSGFRHDWRCRFTRIDEVLPHGWKWLPFRRWVCERAELCYTDGEYK